MKIDLWIKEWTSDHQTGFDPDEECGALLIDRIDIKGIPVYSSSSVSTDADLWPATAVLCLDGFMHLILTKAPDPFFDLFTPDEFLWGTDRESGLLLLNVSGIEYHLQGKSAYWPYGQLPPLNLPA